MKSNAVRIAELRGRDEAKRIKRIELRIPELYDVDLKMLAEDLRKGMKLEGVVMRDPKTGRVTTRPI